MDFKEFHGTLELMEFFHRNKRDVTDPLNNQSMIKFMNQNAQEDPEEPDNMEIWKSRKYLNPSLVGGQTHRIEPWKSSKDLLNRNYSKINLNIINTITWQSKKELVSNQ